VTASAEPVSFFDTSSRPSEAMRAAMAAAPLGDDVYGTDPTVNRLQMLAAELLGFEAALFVPSGTMANLIAVCVHARPGDAVVLEAGSHLAVAETGGVAAVAGCMPIPVAAPRGVLTAAHVAEAVLPDDVHRPAPRLVCIENTHNRGGGAVTPPPVMEELVTACRERDLALHVDGARALNAAVALGVPVAEVVAGADSVSLALSKGLRCPVGSLLAGSAAFVAEARRRRKLLGGAMRQAGVVAAAGVVALESGVPQLVEDHRRARALAERLDAIPALAVDLDAVETNIVLCDVSATGRPAARLVEELAASGIECAGRGHDRVRFVTHAGTGAEAVDRLLARVEAILNGWSVL
jgi:threonine aldolase